MAFSDFLSEVFKSAAQVGRAFLGVVAPAVRMVVASAKALVDGLFAGAQQGMREDPKTVMERNERELQEVNGELMHLKQRHRSNGSLNGREMERWRELNARRDVLNGDIADIDQVVTAREVVAEEESYRPVVINDSTAHILQYHVGQSTYNKRCGCGRVMVLQWNRNATTAELRDFFWGCSGWYEQVNGEAACSGTKALTRDDLNLFANLNRPEFEINAPDLTRATVNPVKARRIRQALDSIKDSHDRKRLGLLNYRCPIHGESLRLKRKLEPTDQLLDAYFLGCPRWLPGNAGCNFLMKLKSAAQISSVLDAEHSMGVLGT